MTHLDDLLAAADSRAQDNAVPDMDSRPSRKVAVLACMDTRIDPYKLLGLERGEAHVIRNAGGLVTDDAVRSLAASQRLLGTEEVVVVMHEGCGLNGASEDDFRRMLAGDGVLPDWRLGAFDDVETALRQGLQRLRSEPALVARDRIHGVVYDPGSGRIREVDAPGT